MMLGRLFDPTMLAEILLRLPAILIALTVHEFAHTLVAFRLGDDTAKADGRLSLDPLKHLDPVGFLMLMLIGFGWAKPVPVNTRRFKNPKRDIALVSAAGPLSNFLQAFAGVLLLFGTVALAGKIGWFAGGYESDQGDYAFKILASTVYANPSKFLWMPEAMPAMAHIFMRFLAVYVRINIVLGLFNLIPFPPLDGSNILGYFLPQKWAMKYYRLGYYQRYIFMGLAIVSLAAPIVSYIVFYPISVVTGWLFNLFFSMAGWFF